jgi:hypothetical protein
VLVVISHTLNTEAFTSETDPPELDTPIVPNPDVGHLQRSCEVFAN